MSEPRIPARFAHLPRRLALREIEALWGEKLRAVGSERGSAAPSDWDAELLQAWLYWKRAACKIRSYQKKHGVPSRPWALDEAERLQQRRTRIAKTAARNAALRRSAEPMHVARQRLYAIRASAKSRMLDCDLESVEALIEAAGDGRCWYCGDGPLAYQLDRIDNAKGYSRANCCPACTPCNRMKGTMTREQFVARMCHVAVRIANGALTPPAGLFVATKPSGAAANKSTRWGGKPCELTNADINRLYRETCHYCGLPEGRNVARIDSSEPYRLDNVRPCCSTCKMLSKGMQEAVFLAKAAAIRARHDKTA